MACWSFETLEILELQKPLREYSRLLLGETDGAARGKCEALVIRALAYEHARRRRWALIVASCWPVTWQTMGGNLVLSREQGLYQTQWPLLRLHATKHLRPMGAIGGISADLCLTCPAASSGTSGRLQSQLLSGAVSAQQAALQRGRPSSASHA